MGFSKGEVKPGAAPHEGGGGGCLSVNSVAKFTGGFAAKFTEEVEVNLTVCS